jgi:predicted transcriptional regulator
MTKIDIKMMHSTELRELRSMIREELDFRAEVGKEINEQQAGIRNYVEGSFEHMVNNEI